MLLVAVTMAMIMMSVRMMTSSTGISTTIETSDRSTMFTITTARLLVLLLLLLILDFMLHGICANSSNSCTENCS